MKKVFFVLGIAALIITSCTTHRQGRNLSYEAYCDSIWTNDPDYYLDVLCETDEYQQYIEQNGRWW